MKGYQFKFIVGLLGGLLGMIVGLLWDYLDTIRDCVCK